MDFEELYLNVCGMLIENDDRLNIFKNEDKCAKLYKKAFDIKQSLYLRLISDEDEELTLLLDLYDEMHKQIAEKIYQVAKSEMQDTN